MEATPRAPSDGSSPGQRQTRQSRIKKRVSVACDTCRRRKTKCDGAKPECKFCKDLGKKCVYAAPRGALTRYPTEERNVPTRLAQLEALVTQLTHNAFDEIGCGLNDLDSGHQRPDALDVPHVDTTPISAAEETTHTSPLGVPPQPEAPYQSFEPSEPTPESVWHPPYVEDARATPSISTAPELSMPGHESLTGVRSGTSDHPVIHTAPGRIPRLEYSSLAACFKSEMLSGNHLLQTFEQEEAEVSIHDDELDDSTIHRLQQSYFSRVNPWFPVIDECSSWPESFAQAEMSNFRGNDIQSALVLLVLALGNIAEEGVKPTTDPDTVLATRLFNKAFLCVMAKGLQTDLHIIQCYILITYGPPNPYSRFCRLSGYLQDGLSNG
ncbi:hypothetical protein BHE90_005340 [Fusarium euwallaceae]|uniref:Zn(2)-C6 fungal-type domain-containing protein n=1 Tax=Fusarium euwallaceae TaxID=1147111 RepID=A0A430LWQ1_9HYPO|nr:hypothetical protein BHE90_005340 [Fusarium euwallaceae]